MTRRYDTLWVGDLAPWFRARCIGQQSSYSFEMAAGRHVVLCFHGAARDPLARQALRRIEERRALFEGGRVALFGVSIDAGDPPVPGLRQFADADGAVCRAFGVAPREGAFDLADLRRGWFVLDPRLRVVAVFPLGDEGDAAAMRYLHALPRPAAAQVPVLMISGVFEPAFCQRLVALHRSEPGRDSAILTEGGAVTDHRFKRRRDCLVADPALAAQVQTRIFRRVVPEIRHAFQFHATRLERMIIACYDAAEDGRFGGHRDNTIAATAHRRFAVSINLNDDFDGGGIAFPEYGTRVFTPATGAALVFSCSLLHEVVPMTRGRRYACLPFVYDDAAAKLRREMLAASAVPP